MMKYADENPSRTRNLAMFGVPDIDTWFKTASVNNTVSDLILGLSSDAQACMEIGSLSTANWRLNRIKWLVTNKLNVS